MPEMTDATKKTADADAPNTSVTVQPAAPEPPANLDHTEIRGRFNQYQSGYWALAVPLLSARYIADGLNGVLEHVIKVKLPQFRWADKAWSVAVGVGMLGVTGFYTNRTYGDMKREFAEPLAWEFNKDPKDVGLRDMLRSKNTLIHDAIHNFISRSEKRVVVDLPFFAYLVPSPFKKSAGEFNAELKAKGKEAKELSQLASPKEAVNLGVGANAVYLATDALGRRRTFFEELQNFVDNKINHSDQVGESITESDLMNLYNRQARHNAAVRPLPKMGTAEWDSDKKLFSRMADLMNQTYGNEPNKEQANFTVPKLIYMLGMRLLKSDNPEKNMAYLELANRYGIKAVDSVARTVNGHGNLQQALIPYPDVATKIMQMGLSAESSSVASAEPALGKPEKSFANDGLKKARPEAPPGAQVDKITQNDLAAGLAVGR